jgi:translation initiation factor IF-2
MSKVRVYEVAKQLNLDPKAVVALFQAVGVSDVRNHMSSVEPEQVERVKRHLEKQKTHDVVEERIHRGVVKRRAVAKPGDVPAAAASSPSLADVASSRDIASLVEPSPARGSSPRLETDVIAKDRESTKAFNYIPEARASGAHQEERKSTRDVSSPVPPAPKSVPAERRSAKTLERHSEPKVVEAPVSKPSVSAVEARRDAAAQAAPSSPAVPQAAPSNHDVVAAAGSSPAIASVPSTAAVTSPAPEARIEHHEPEVIPPPPPAVMAEEVRIITPAPEPVLPPPPVEEPAPRASTVPKTGVEYWTGRPGVPMPTPINAPRTGIGGGATSNLGRRHEYNPRAGVGAGPGARPGMRPGTGGTRGGPMMGRGGPGQRGRMGGAPMVRRPVQSTTQEMSAHKKVIRIEENITLSAMAQKMSLKSTELLMKLLGMGMTGVHINTTLDADTAKILASEFGWEVEDVAISEEASIAAARGEETAAVPVAGEVVAEDPNVTKRPPVVTVMGHVDHGKTSLLDRIRKANVASGEAGGITQHIGAYKAMTPHGPIVFLDTPGHEAFTQMRARGSNVADVVVLVVAADDGVMPQTKEAVAHAKAAKTPIIVAVNKIDKPGAEPERVRRELVELGLQPEEWGGDTIFVNVSAQTGEGIDTLLEMISLQSDVLDLKVNPKKPASGTVLEALLDRGRGPVARVLVQEGTLRVGDFVLAGQGFGKVRAMTNEHGKQIHEAPPATPVEILGLSDVPNAGDPMHAVKDPKKAQEIAEGRKGKMAKSLIPTTAKVSLEELSRRISDSQQELRVIVKGDVQGSVEAVADALSKLSGDRVRLSVINAAVGAITEGDVNLAIASKAIIIGFNVRPAGKASQLAEENKIEIRPYSIIYAAVDDVKGAMEGLLPAILVEKPLGKAEIRAVFKIRGVAVAGSMVTEGIIKRGTHARVIRDGAVVFEGKLSNLKRFKDDAKDVAEGFECGISLEGYNEFKELDIISCFEIDEVKQRL